MYVSHMNPSWTKIHVQTSFYMVHTVNLQWHARNLVKIGLHGSLTNEYATRLTQISSRPYPTWGGSLGRLKLVEGYPI